MSYTDLPIIISVGGGLIVPNGGIDYEFLKKLNKFIRAQVKAGRRFFLVAGGGRTARHYRDAGRAVIGGMTDEDLDWLGIHASRLNGHLLRTIFQDIAHPRIIENYDKKLTNWHEPIVIGAGWKPGWSTDYCAAFLAKDYGANLVINLSNIDWVYDKDPRVHKDAQAIEKLTWDEMEKLVGTKWIPGMNAPFDPIAAQLAKHSELTVIVANGNNIPNLNKIMTGDSFAGTVIMPHRIDASFYNRAYYTGEKGEHRLGYRDTILGTIVHGFTAVFRALSILLFLRPKKVLDVGCGTGELVSWLRFFGVEAYGIDISSHAIEFVHPSVRRYVKTGDILNLPYDDKSFDLVTSFDVLEHIERSKLKKALSETARVSRNLIFHKIYTRENSWIRMFHRHDRSHLSILSRRDWDHILGQFTSFRATQTFFVKLPIFMESVFLLRKRR